MLTYGDKTIRLAAKVDTGAAVCLFSRAGAVRGERQRRRIGGGPRSDISAHNENGQIKLQSPGRLEIVAWKRSLTKERIKNHHSAFTYLDHDHGVLLIEAVNRRKVEKSNRVMAVFNQRLQFIDQEVVFGCSRETELAGGVNGFEGVRSKRRAIAEGAQSLFFQFQAKVAQNHSQTGRDTGIFGFLFMERGLR